MKETQLSLRTNVVLDLEIYSIIIKFLDMKELICKIMCLSRDVR
jgi:hypothetical protein